MEVSQDDKTVLRRKFKELRREFKLGLEGRKASAGLTHNLKRLIEDYADHQCCLYQTRADEAPADLAPIQDYFFPRIEGERIEFRKPATDQAFAHGPLAIREPLPQQSAPLNPELPVLVCTPAVAVDRQGGRVGMGRGFYDRFFAEHPRAVRVGVVFQVQVSGLPLPAESWDQALDWIVTEQMILRTSSPTRSSLLWT